MRSIRLFLIACLGLSGALGMFAQAAGVDSSPLAELHWTSPPSVSDGVLLGSTRLPISAEQPDIVTYARVDVWLFFPTQEKRAFPYVDLRFSFPDPQPFGLPFTFQKVQVSWANAQASGSQSLDWSHDGLGVGRSMFPGQSWSARIPLPDSGNPPLLETLRVLVWGSRN